MSPEVQSGNAMMMQRILHMPYQPFTEGQFVYRVVRMRGRKSRELRQVPLAVFQYQGCPYLIAPSHQRDWVANLLADHNCLLISVKGEERFTSEVTTDEQAIGAALRYRHLIGNGFSSEQFPFGMHATREEVASSMGQMAIFRLTPQVDSGSSEDL